MIRAFIVRHGAVSLLFVFIIHAGVPGYCGDRLYRAQAGGYFCSKFDYNKVHGH